MESRIEMLLNALINGETIDFEPQSRMEAYLKNCINNTKTEGLPPPESRIDALLYKLAENGCGIDTSDATATAEDILKGKTAYVNDVKVSGTIDSKSAETYTPGTTNKTISAGVYLSGNQTIKGDTNLTEGNIKNGVEIFGVIGTLPEKIDTSDATATAEDILKGKTAYVNDVKVTGTKSVVWTTGTVLNDVTEVNIFPGVTNIGEGAFKDFANLTTITIPDSVTHIEKYAFKSCSKLTEIQLPDSVKYIGASPFELCTSLESITIPSGSTFESNFCFYGCTNLTNVTIPDDVICIGTFRAAFTDCTSLTDITIPNGVTSIGDSGFYGCTSLASIIIPDGVTSIERVAFYNCTSLASIIIPDGVTSIGDSTFAGCTSLASIMIPDGVTSIGKYAFNRCTSLASIIIPDRMTSIELSTFAGCTSLASIMIPDGVTSIGDNAFFGCKSLADIYYTGTEEQWNAITKGNNWNNNMGSNVSGGTVIHYNHTG